jgi:hypothetical protein
MFVDIPNFPNPTISHTESTIPKFVFHVVHSVGREPLSSARKEKLFVFRACVSFGYKGVEDMCSVSSGDKCKGVTKINQQMMEKKIAIIQQSFSPRRSIS